MRDGQLRRGCDEVEGGYEEAVERPGGEVFHQVGDERGCGDCQADGEEVKTAPDDGASRLGCQMLREAAECQASDKRVCRNRTHQKEECLSRAWDPARGAPGPPLSSRS